ncbi:kinase domain protein (macronuclear) [Tetrahymena thermophila SB210]|uniref:Kinase domain protein n=1 Tax=Tetrahymena thermophila (strain SB210) TaxID=312017 RepID=Q23G00_TETTS|nr:kinase domain protein [Tetrahymena thermophila SB210]EAR95460.2 kinase domain protein [Tetrahymena thermophila SB210]|eukprot:XP_001015705.2 kinase domain protein [Tetrahymena thermophila SB210]
MGMTPSSKLVQHIQNQQREKQLKFLEKLSQSLNKTPQEAEQITWMMQNKQYEIDFLILGTGGNGVVIRGYDKQENKPIAIKIMKFKTNDQCERLLNEFKLLQQCQGTQILRVKEIYISYKMKLQFMIMEYCPFDLKTYLKRIEEKRSNIKIAYVLQICQELVSGLKQIHENGIIHLDIKPANILFSPNSIWKYSDFGLSRKFKHVVNNNTKKQTDNTNDNQGQNGSDSPTSPNSSETIEENMIKFIKIIPEGYTPQYASPEQYQIVNNKDFTKNVTDKSDIYSLGIVFLELTGVKISNEIIQKMKTDANIDPSSQFNPQYQMFNETVLKRMLSFDPQMRPTLEEVQHQIQKILIKNRDRGISSITNSPMNVVRGETQKKQNQVDIDFTKLACVDENEFSNDYQKPEIFYINQGGIDLTQQDITEIVASTTKKIDINVNQQNIDFIKIR